MLTMLIHWHNVVFPVIIIMPVMVAVLLIVLIVVVICVVIRRRRMGASYGFAHTRQPFRQPVHLQPLPQAGEDLLVAIIVRTAHCSVTW